MSINEIESEVDRLSLAEQQELLRHLEASLRARRRQAPLASREEWMNRLEVLRRSINTGGTTPTGEQILAELREE